MPSFGAERPDLAAQLARSRMVPATVSSTSARLPFSRLTSMACTTHEVHRADPLVHGSQCLLDRAAESGLEDETAELVGGGRSPRGPRRRRPHDHTRLAACPTAATSLS